MIDKEKQLEEIKNMSSDWNILFNGGTPKKTRKRSNKGPEAEIQKAVLSYLRKCPSVAWCHRMNTGAAKIGSGYGKQRFIRFGFPGCSDVIGQMKDGRLLAVEVKAPSGRLSETQKDFLDLVIANHGVAGVVRSVDDVEALIKENSDG